MALVQNSEVSCHTPPCDLLLIASVLGGDGSWKDYPAGRDFDDKNTNSYRDRSFDDDYEAERDDSDTESNHNYTSNNARRYKDTESIGSPTTPEKRVCDCI